MHFVSGGEGYTLQLREGRITADMGLNLPAGEWEVYLHGVEEDDSGNVLRRATTETVRLYVQDFAGFEGEGFPDAPPGLVGELERELAALREELRLRQPGKNLLDNWYFPDPVNQRGGESYTGAVYGPDRWKGGTNASAVSVRADGLHLTGGYILQRVERPERLEGREFTYSVLVDANSAASVSSIRYRANGTGTIVANIPRGETGLFTGRFTAPAGLEGVTVVLGGSGEVLLRAIKLEAGTEQTLAHQDAQGEWVLNELPDKGAELLKCQRYYQLFSSDAARPAAAVDYRPALRAEPEMGTITMDGVTYYSASAEL